LDAVVVDRIKNVRTPFKIEFARKSRSRGYGPTLVRVDKGGAEQSGTILVLKDDITVEEGRKILRERERGAPVEELHDFCGVETVLYADPHPNIEKLGPKVLASLAIDSVRLADQGRDGITYLINTEEIGIATPFMQEYEKEVLQQTSAKSRKCFQMTPYSQIGHSARVWPQITGAKPSVELKYLASNE